MKFSTLIGLIIIGIGCTTIHIGLGLIYVGLIIMLPTDDEE